ncbi:MAG: putative DNA-binding domain-containing protein [Sphingobacteriaceae bacterium]|nr:putative DNA-binding domain-containing protein [Sphingobacteriaceae bacterium]
MLNKETKSQQSLLANYCRDGQTPNGLINVKSENLHHYRRLVFNIASDILETAFPITFSFLEENVWQDLVHTYFKEHKCQTNQVWRMPLEFYDYCKEKNIAEKLNLPYLNNLLYFEWLELDVHTMEDMEFPEFKSNGDLLADPIVFNPEYKLIPFTFPVHKIPPGEELLNQKGNYFLLIYREKESGNVQFIDLSMFYTFLLENIANGLIVKDILVDANSMFGINDIKLLKENTLLFLQDLQKRKFILGFKK